MTINIPLSKEMTSRDIRQIYQDRYAGEKLVKVVGEAPYVKSIQNKHGVEIGGFAVDDTGKRVVVRLVAIFDTSAKSTWAPANQKKCHD